jgi:hypothetical protein
VTSLPPVFHRRNWQLNAARWGKGSAAGEVRP